MGTSVISGSARLLVARTGESSAMGAIAGELDTTPPPTSFEVGVRRFGFLIMRMTLLLVLFALLVATSLAVVAAAALVPWTPLAAYFGFVPPPPSLYGVVVAMVAIYLVLVQWVKRRFYQLHPAA